MAIVYSLVYFRYGISNGVYNIDLSVAFISKFICDTNRKYGKADDVSVVATG